MKVMVFGYSENPERYSHMASELLAAYGHERVLVNPRNSEELNKLSESAHTLTLYVNPAISTKYKNQLLALDIKRVIFNPGTESVDLMQAFEKKGVEVVEGCTLVMLKTSQF